MLACTLCVCAGTVFAADAPLTAQRDQIRWSNGLSDAVVGSTPDQVRGQLGELAARAEARRIIVTLDAAPTQAQRDRLAQTGLQLLSPLGGTSYFAALAATADAARLSEMGVSQASAIDATRKMHAEFLAGLVRSWTVVGPTPQKLRDQFDSGMITIEEFRRAGADPIVAVLVALHADAALDAVSGRLAIDVGGEVRSKIRSVNTAVMHVPVSRLAELAADDSVMWIEPPLPALSDLNAENRVLTGVNTVNASPYGLDGSGVTVMVYDGGRVFPHGDFAGRLTIGASDTAGVSDHATHVMGTIGSSGAGNNNHRGMAPGVGLVSYGFEQAGGLQQGFLYTDPGDIEADYSEGIASYGSDISNNSLGTNTAPNGYPCDWTGNYGITSALIDEIARGSLGSPFRIIWANGNERQSSRCQGDDNGNHGEFYSTAPPAGAKNHIAVGSVDSNTDLTSSFSSWGPVDDGRIKPDISAPGCQTTGDSGVTSTSSSGGYNVKCGTSMASPTVCGISALLMEQYRLSFPDRDDMRNCTLKALLANTAVDRGNVGPDYKYGYGSVRAVPAVDAIIAENVIEGDVSQGEVYTFVVIIGAGDSELRVTTAWDDASATPNAGSALVNDLDLRVIDPGGAIHLPWTLNPANPNANAVRNVRDGVNNIEQVVIDAPAPGAYLVEISGFNIASGGAQPFGAVSNGFLVNCSSAGRVSISGGTLPCEGDTEVSVVDCDLNTSDSVLDQVDVQVVSDTDPVGFVLTLIETDPASAKFAASFSHSAGSQAYLQVANGDSVTVSYIDADDGQGNSNLPVFSTATIDCSPPLVLAASASAIEPRSATINVQLDEPASVTIRYGTSLGSLNGSAEAGAALTNHAVNLSGLTDDTSYVFVVDAVDPAGNMVTSNNNGSGYAFTTPDVPDYFTEQFASGIDLGGKRVIFTPSGTFEFYTACVEDLAGAYATDPAGGQNLPMSDDDFELISFQGGSQFNFYGEDYSSVYVGSNGYLTFGSGTTAYTESLSEHFNRARISGLFDDLNPSTGGTVSWKQTPDRVAVTWNDVSQYSNSDSNNFQIEMFFDGRVAISHLSVQSGDAIVGLSAGNGVDPAFVASDLSTSGDCNDCVADLAEPFGTLNFFDVSAFVTLYNAQDSAADLAAPFGTFNFFDVSEFITLYNSGCP
jgi:hypothetical protein